MTSTDELESTTPGDYSPPNATELARRIADDNATLLNADDCTATLSRAVDTALSHARNMASMLSVPLALVPGSQSRAPLAQALFASRAEEEDVLRHAAHVRAVFEDRATRCAFLMTMRRREYELLGSELEGDMVRSGVLQHAVEFLDHHIPLAAPDLEGLGNMLAREIVLYLAAIAPRQIRKNQAAKAEIIRSETLLKAQIHTLEQARGEHRPIAVPSTLRAMLLKGEQELDGIRGKLSALPQELDRSQCLQELQNILREPDRHIRLERVEMRVGDFGIKTPRGEPITFHECVCEGGHRLAVVVAEIQSDAAAFLWPDLPRPSSR